MAFIKTRGNQRLPAWPLAAVVTVLTVTACGSSAGSPGHWTQAEVSQLLASASQEGSSSQNSCIFKYVERDMSFDNAMALNAVDPTSASMSPAQIEAAVISKFGAAKGHAIASQFRQFITDSVSKCSGAAASFTAPPSP